MAVFLSPVAACLDKPAFLTAGARLLQSWLSKDSVVPYLSRQTTADEMEDPNLILTVRATDREAALQALQLPHNIDRYVSRHQPQGCVESREITPTEEDDPDLENAEQLRLTFDRPPKDIGRGFSFGTDKDFCDVLLAAKRRQYNISGVHFYITFDMKGRLILRDESTRGTAVSYGNWGKRSKRHHFTWILEIAREPEVEIQVRLPNNVTFDLVLATHETCSPEYRANVTSYLKRSYIQTRDPTALPTEPFSPRQRPMYLPLEENLGKGSFGEVNLVTDVSTAKVYAAKTFKKDKEIENEVKIMRSISHRHIVQFVDFVDEDSPQLIMEYLPFGNLDQEHHRCQITPGETVLLLFQCLLAIEHLHAKNISHRDLKPANILVESRVPFCVKLCDFGIAKVADSLTVLDTFCGSYTYIAPEIYIGGVYSPAVDLWSLGVIIWQYAHGHDKEDPIIPSGNDTLEVSQMQWAGIAWCQYIVEIVNISYSHSLIDLLLTGMLRIEPAERLSASECLMIMEGLDSSVDHSLNLRSIAATPEASQINDDEADDGTSVIALPSWICLSPRSPSEKQDETILKGSTAQKRRRSPAGSSTPKTSGMCSSKRLQRCEIANTESSPVPEASQGSATEQVVMQDMSDAVCGLLRDLRHEKDCGAPVDRGTSTLISIICKEAERLEITKFTKIKISGCVKVIGVSKYKDLEVVNLTMADRTNTTMGLAAHLLYGIQRLITQGTSAPTNKSSRLSRISRRYEASDKRTVTSKSNQFPDKQTFIECPVNNHVIHIRTSDMKICLDDLAKVGRRSDEWVKQELEKIAVGLKDVCLYGTLIDYKVATPYIEQFGLVKKLRKFTGIQEPPKVYEHEGHMFHPITVRGTVVYICPSQRLINASHLAKAAGFAPYTLRETLVECGISEVRKIIAAPRLRGTFVRYDDAPALCRYLGLELPGEIEGAPIAACEVISAETDEVRNEASRRENTEDLEPMKDMSFFTEPSRTNGSFLPVIKDHSHLQPIHPNLQPSSNSSSGYGCSEYDL
ncbi:hypothetical protein PRK78_003806 [Emydomyces testavorans]|uniref:Protein kinase domain-containing protein n=1 Tax=Emydomyces testavorans TaxID=2070801 RepID=A0AAF0DHG3_9EURO|nr:hypothetical protein PRK78_003806 [Emydomyces testavorans]